MENGENSYRRFIDGDKSAFDEIMKKYFDHVVHFIDGYLHDTALSEDIAIDVFAYLAFRKGYNGRSSLKTYLYTIARSRALNALKKRKEILPLEEAILDDAERFELEEKVFADERKRIIAQTLSKLPEEQQQAVYLVYFEELSYTEAASVMKKSKKQIDNLLYRAKNTLRITLGEEGKMLL